MYWWAETVLQLLLMTMCYIWGRDNGIKTGVRRAMWVKTTPSSERWYLPDDPYCTRPEPHECRVNGPCNGLPND